jgi:uncharacterized protein
MAVAYSGGVDSSYLAAVADEALGNKCFIVIADSPSIPRSELKDAISLAEERSWNLHVIKTEEHLDKNYQENSGDRCYFCKDELFVKMEVWCHEKGIQALAYGAIVDDLGDHRPGAKAAEEHQILAPLQDAELSKEEIRELSRQRELPTHSKPSFACLASRLPVGEQVTVKKLSQIEMAEEILKSAGIKQYRARHHNDICRIEVALDELEMVILNRESISASIKKLGYRFVTLDLCGYRTGSTNGEKKTVNNAL